MNNDHCRLDRLKSLRIDRDKTQKEVAKALNIAPNTLSQYEAGTRNIPNVILKRMALFYGTSADYILGLTDQLEPYPRK